MSPLIALFAFASALVLLSIAPGLVRTLRSALVLAAKLSRKRTLAAIVVAMFAGVVCIVPGILWGSPAPLIHDEFVYLLQGDTFAHGRLSNPAHPFWRHFETFHVIQQPTYAAKFPVGQGIALAIGQLIQLPIAGAWLSTAIASVAILWMLRPIVGARWALVGALLSPILPIVQSWSQCYWGGSVAMIGGALLCGAAARFNARITWKVGAVAGIGLAILANSRPFEGLLLTIFVGIFVLACAIKSARFASLIIKFVAPAAVVLAPAVAWMAYYNYRVTGDPLTLPYALHAKQYMRHPIFFGQRMPEPKTYTHATMREFFERDEFAEFQRAQTLQGWMRETGKRFAFIISAFFFPWPIAIPLLALPWITRNRNVRWMTLLCVLVPAAHACCTPWLRMQYLAPLLGCWIAVIVAGLGWIWNASARHAHIARIVAGSILVCECAVGVAAMIHLKGVAHRPSAEFRADITRELTKQGGKHLILLSYAPGHWPVIDYAFNGADIDGSNIIWARSIDEASDLKLLEYFADRTIWTITTGAPDMHVSKLRDAK